jgi:hypothetical protein
LILSNNNLMKSNISPDPVLEVQIAAVRGFSRFYTRKLGIIEPKLLDSPWTLQEARIIYEIAPIWSARWVSMPDSSAAPCRHCIAARLSRESRQTPTAASPSSH